MNKTISFISALGIFTLITLGCEDITQKTIEENSSSSLSSSSAFSSSLFSSSSFASFSSQESGINSTQSKNTLGYYGEDTLFANRLITGWWLEFESETLDDGIKYFERGYGFRSDGSGFSNDSNNNKFDFTYGVDKDTKSVRIEFTDENDKNSIIELKYIDDLGSCSRMNILEDNQVYMHKVCKTYTDLINQEPPVLKIPSTDMNNTSLLKNRFGYYGKGVKFAGYNLINIFYEFNEDTVLKFKEDGMVARSSYKIIGNNSKGYYYGVDVNGSTLTMASSLKGAQVTITWKYLGDVEDCAYIEESVVDYLFSSSKYRFRICMRNIK